MFKMTFAPAQELTHTPSLSQTDALLSLIYTTLQSPLIQPPTTPINPTSAATTTTLSPAQIDLPFLTNLTNLFTTSPDPQVRDSTHHLTTLLLHNHTTQTTKLLYIKSLLSPHTSPTPIHEIQEGNLRAIATNWLKDEFLTTTNATATATATATHLPATLLTTDPDLPALLFPALPKPPSPLLSPPQQTQSDPTGPTTESDLETFLLQIPSYIASLNLICILSSIPSHDGTESILTQPHPNPNPETETETHPLTNMISTFVSNLSGWSDVLLGLTTGIAARQAQGQEGPVNVADVYALADAVGRAKEAVEGL